MAEIIDQAKWTKPIQPISSISSDRSEGKDVIDRLEDAARAKDERAFINLLEDVNWKNRPSKDFIRVIKLALKAGAHLAARHISIDGANQHPDNIELQKYAQAFAPPKVISRELPPNPAYKAYRQWLKANGSKYRGQWVAVRNGELLGAANSVEELVKHVGDTKDVMLTKA